MSTGNKQLQKYARPLLTTDTVNDKDKPASFQEWYDAHQGIIPGDEFKQYNAYLVEWYKAKSNSVTDYKQQLRLNYLRLLKQLQIFFSREEAENWYNNVNVDNEKELLLAIPYFAKKLKDISLYYLQLRTAIKESRLRYNQVGTNFGLLQQIQKQLFLNYTKKPNTAITLPASVWRNVPDLSAVQDTLTLQIEELYDLHKYFDQSPTVPLSAYYDLTNVDLQNFLTNKNLALTSAEWFYKLGIFALSSDYVIDEFTGVANDNDLVLAELNNLLSQKYLGDSKYLTTVTPISTQTDFYEVSVASGNNFFYWPYGTYSNFSLTLPRYESIPLTGANIEAFATAGSSIELADTIFIKTPRGVKGAWLRDETIEYRKDTMVATLDLSRKTTFRYPFPGFGISAEDIGWTGYSLVTDPRFFFLKEQVQQEISNIYWTDAIDLTAVKPLLVNETTLIDNKAYASKSFPLADKIRVWPFPPAYISSSYSGDVQEAWLYRMEQTDISIKPGDNVIYWPYESINPGTSFPAYYPRDISNTCDAVPVSSISFNHPIAGNSLTTSDVIYKLRNYQDSIDLATECCWLSSITVSYAGDNVDYVLDEETSLQGIFKAGSYTRFIWNGVNDLNVNLVFKSLQHQPDCPFISSQLELTYEDHELCTCRQVQFTPFGHPGENFVEYGSLTDYILEDITAPGVPDLGFWKDKTNTTFSTSSAFCWFKTDSKQGWGNGRWYSGDVNQGNSFYLKKGKAYLYYRANTQKQNKTSSSLPDLVQRYSYQNYRSNYNTKFVWTRAEIGLDGTWYNTGEPSTMVLYPGDIINYRRLQTKQIELTSTVFDTYEVAENRNDTIWSNYDYISVNNSLRPVIVGYPTSTYPGITALNSSGSYPGQYPLADFLSTVVSVSAWTVTSPGGTTIYRNTPSIQFVPQLTGVYTVAVTVITGNKVISNATTTSQLTENLLSYTRQLTGFYTHTVIPPITVVPDFTFTPVVTSDSIPMPGYVLNTQLKGWNYKTSTKGGYVPARDSGARPFWAKTYLEKDLNTGYKGIESWGTPQRIVDNHNVLTQPEYSDITLFTGNQIEYTRNYPSNLIWIQPVDLGAATGNKRWCELEFNTTGQTNLIDQLQNIKTELIVTPTLSTSTIILENYVDNIPVEIHYNAILPFVWSITAIPIIEKTIKPASGLEQLAIEALQPWANLPNQFYPTFAIFPALDQLSSTSDLGGYFIPNNLGASVYIDNGYTRVLNLTSKDVTEFYENSNSKIGGRGLTLTEQSSPNTSIENNLWLKESTLAGSIAGTNNKKIFKKYQKFLPYQSEYETNNLNQIGLILPNSRQTPWGGKEDSEWTDIANYPVSFTGELNIANWSASQVLKQFELQIDNWVTDVFGNQYGLYKDLRGIAPQNRRLVPGELWVRKNNQKVTPASIALSGVFDSYINTTILNELTGEEGILKIDMFFDTLLVETSGAIIFEKLNYDYTTDRIFSLLDDSKQISLAMPVSANFIREFNNTPLTNYNFAKPGETWFFPDEKFLTISVCGLDNRALKPELYQYNLNDRTLRKIWPLTPDENTEISINLGGAENVISFEPPLLSYNDFLNEYLLVISYKRLDFVDNFIAEFKIKATNQTPARTKEIVLYRPNDTNVLLEPPAIIAPLDVYVPIPQPLGQLYNTLLDTVTAGTKIISQLAYDRSLSIITVPQLTSPGPVYENIYPISAISVPGFIEPMYLNYFFYDFDLGYIEKFGDETLVAAEPLDYTVAPVANGPVIFTPVSIPDWVTLTPDGRFTGIPPAIPNKTYNATFKVENSVGPIYNVLNIFVI